ncbi:MAG: 23S rRNA (pseudouridine(1915)-N(3))-methyltransferase RlmH [Saprospiraceae bacterium]|nr:23S rRNA (pseudouridine(1915)-N(3))-methyltransferase RlmH [Saprospiraceae bacterium]
MQIELWWIGRTRTKYLQPGIDDYIKRINFFHRFEIREFSSSRSKKSQGNVKIDDENYLKQIGQRDLIVLLDESGKNMTSAQFARQCEKYLLRQVSKVIFIIGGPYGFGPELYKRADAKIALSDMTFTHDMVRLIFLEQLYRAFTINKNLPYHH